MVVTPIRELTGVDLASLPAIACDAIPPESFEIISGFATTAFVADDIVLQIVRRYDIRMTGIRCWHLNIGQPLNRLMLYGMRHCAKEAINWKALESQLEFFGFKRII